MVSIYFYVFGRVFLLLVRSISIFDSKILSIFLLGASPSLQSKKNFDFSLLAKKENSFFLFRFLSLSVFNRSLSSYNHRLSIRLSSHVSSRRFPSSSTFSLFVHIDHHRHGSIRIYIRCC